MFNPRISSIVAAVAFLLSLLIGLISGSSFPTLVIRPVVFAVFFFIFSGLGYFLILRFLPELLESGGGAPELVLPGSRIDITEDAPIAPSVSFARPDETDKELGDISELINSGLRAPEAFSETQAAPTMDQTEETVYNDINVSGSLSGDEDSFDALPDLESLVGTFLPSSGEKEEEIQEYSSSEPVKRPTSGNKAQKMDADFHPKELAAGIRTVLNKDDV